jgi:hypothetical protein
MAGLWTNRGKKAALAAFLRGTAISGSAFRLVLCTSANTPTVDTNTLSELTEVAAGNGYTSGGIAVAQSAVGWPTLTEDDTNDSAIAEALAAIWTASGTGIPFSGSGPRWAVLTDANGTLGSREVFAFFDLVVTRTLTAGSTLQLDCSLELKEC